jgi:hypothetical protein
MAHFIRPSSSSPFGYDVDHKLAPGSVWRMQVPRGARKSIALYGGKGLWVKSNNPDVLPNDGFREESDGELRILSLLGRGDGTSMLEVGQGPQPWISLQVQVGDVSQARRKIENISVNITNIQNADIIGQAVKLRLPRAIRNPPGLKSLLQSQTGGGTRSSVVQQLLDFADDPSVRLRVLGHFPSISTIWHHDFTVGLGPAVSGAAIVFSGSLGAGVYWWNKPAGGEIGLYGGFGIGFSTPQVAYSIGGQLTILFGPAPDLLGGTCAVVGVDISIPGFKWGGGGGLIFSLPSWSAPFSEMTFAGFYLQRRYWL